LRSSRRAEECKRRHVFTIRELNSATQQRVREADARTNAHGSRFNTTRKAAMKTPRIKLYSLTTCAYCQAIKKMLKDLKVVHEFVDADLLTGSDQEALLVELTRVNPQQSFPTLVVDGATITGFKVQEIKEAIGVRTEVDDLYERLRAVQEPKGYVFNQNRERTFDLLRGLLTNREIGRAHV